MKITYDIEHAIRWLVREYRYLEELNEILSRRSTSGIHYADEIKLLHYIKKANKRGNREARIVLSEIEDAAGKELTKQEFNNLFKEVEVPANQLLVKGTFYVSRLKSRLNEGKGSVPSTEREKVRAEKLKVMEGLDIGALEKQIVVLESALKKALRIFYEKEVLPKGVEDKKTKSGAELKKRRRELNKLGLKGGIVTKEKAEAYFTQRFGASYTQIERSFFEQNRTLTFLLASIFGYNGNNLIILFPLRGTLFLYYVVKGFLEEAKRFGRAKNIKCLTIRTSTRKDFVVDLSIKEQIETILHKYPSFAFCVFDYVGAGNTTGKLKKCFAEEGYPMKIIESPREHQQIEIFGEMISPKEILLKKTGSTEISPISHGTRKIFPKGARPTDNLFGQQSASMGFVKEVLTTFGRTYYHIGNYKKWAGITGYNLL